MQKWPAIPHPLEAKLRRLWPSVYFRFLVAFLAFFVFLAFFAFVVAEAALS